MIFPSIDRPIQIHLGVACSSQFPENTWLKYMWPLPTRLLAHTTKFWTSSSNPRPLHQTVHLSKIPQRWPKEPRRSVSPVNTVPGMWTILPDDQSAWRIECEANWLHGNACPCRASFRWRDCGFFRWCTLLQQYTIVDIGNLPDTVPPSESKSRRWKSHNTPDMCAPSAERRLWRDTLLASGTARHARRLLLEELTPYRTLLEPPIVDLEDVLQSKSNKHYHNK